MAILISLEDQTVNNFFSSNIKEKRFSGSAWALWQQDVLGGDGKLSVKEYRRFCDKYEPTKECKNFPRKARRLPSKERKIQIIEYMFKVLNSPPVELHRQFQQISRQGKKTKSSFDWDVFQEDALQRVKKHGYGPGSKKHEKVASLLRPYLAKKNPPSPEILAQTFALGIDLVIIEEKLGAIGDFRGKEKMQRAIKDALAQLRKGTIRLQINPDLEKHVGGQYEVGRNIIRLGKKKPREIFRYEQCHERLHEVFHFVQDLNCISENRVESEYNAYHFGIVASQILFPNQSTDLGLRFSNDFLDIVNNYNREKISKSLETIATNVLAKAGLKIRVKEKKSDTELLKLEEEAKEAINILYSMSRFREARIYVQLRRPTTKLKQDDLGQLPSLKDIASKLLSKRGIWESRLIFDAGRNYLYLFYRRLALEYELAPDLKARNAYFSGTALPLFRKVRPAEMVLIREEGVDKPCPDPKVPMFDERPEPPKKPKSMKLKIFISTPYIVPKKPEKTKIPPSPPAHK